MSDNCDNFHSWFLNKVSNLAELNHNYEERILVLENKVNKLCAVLGNLSYNAEVDINIDNEYGRAACTVASAEVEIDVFIETHDDSIPLNMMGDIEFCDDCGSLYNGGGCFCENECACETGCACDGEGVGTLDEK